MLVARPEPGDYVAVLEHLKPLFDPNVEPKKPKKYLNRVL